MEKGDFVHIESAKSNQLYWAFDTRLGTILVEPVKVIKYGKTITAAQLVSNRKNISDIERDCGFFCTMMEPAGESWEPSETFTMMVACAPSPKEAPYLWRGVKK